MTSTVGEQYLIWMCFGQEGWQKKTLRLERMRIRVFGPRCAIGQKIQEVTSQGGTFRTCLLARPGWADCVTLVPYLCCMRNRGRLTDKHKRANILLAQALCVCVCVLYVCVCV